MKIVWQSFTLILSTFIVFVIVNNESLAAFTPHALGFFVLVWMMVMAYRKLRKKKEIFVGSNFDIFSITITILLTIFLTGGLSSQIFFLLYFLLFGITFMFEPVVLFVFVGTILFLFGQQLLDQNLFPNILTLGSLLLLSPLAFFFGNEFKKREHHENQLEKENIAKIQPQSENSQKKSTTGDKHV